MKKLIEIDKAIEQRRNLYTAENLFVNADGRVECKDSEDVVELLKLREEVERIEAKRIKKVNRTKN